MTQEEKQLLIRDLCARLPYGVKVTYNISGNHFGTISKICEYKANYDIFKVEDGYNVGGYSIKPYLRPMSSMTDKEKDELYTAMDWYGEIDEAGNVYTKGQEKVYRETFYEYTDWLNAHHFDYHGLIPMGLALEAPEGMYKAE